jgi:hypothetical protein
MKLNSIGYLYYSLISLLLLTSFSCEHTQFNCTQGKLYLDNKKNFLIEIYNYEHRGYEKCWGKYTKLTENHFLLTVNRQDKGLIDTFQRIVQSNGRFDTLTETKIADRLLNLKDKINLFWVNDSVINTVIKLDTIKMTTHSIGYYQSLPKNIEYD